MTTDQAPMRAEEVKKILVQRAGLVECFLADCPSGEMPDRLREAMRYSLLAGGKRLRPVLCLTTAQACGLDEEKALPFAASLEFIHTYSLIHDDLPAMDNDDLRRGKPSCHKAFDEATAILAGDALLTDAFALMASCVNSIPADRVLAALRETALAAGSGGMVGGQIIDMLCTGQRAVGPETLRRLDALKTGAMFRASCRTGGLLAGASPAVLTALAAYGEALGAAFQIVDDILDATSDTATLGKPVGSDVQKGKATYPEQYGLERSRELAAQAAHKAVTALDVFDALPQARQEQRFLQGLALYLLERIN